MSLLRHCRPFPADFDLIRSCVEMRLSLGSDLAISSWLSLTTPLLIVHCCTKGVRTFLTW